MRVFAGLAAMGLWLTSPADAQVLTKDIESFQNRVQDIVKQASSRAVISS